MSEQKSELKKHLQEHLKRHLQEHLQKALKINNFKQANLVGITDIPQPMISDYMNGNKIPSLDNVCQIARALNVSLDWLCGLKEAKNTWANADTEMLMQFAGIIENTDGIWETAVDIVEEIEYENECGLKYGKRYPAAICTTNFDFRNFIIEYKRAVNAGNYAVDEYKLEEKIAESMKNAVLDKYIRIFEEKRSNK
jgi:transcriptional regulator with XRE-family HTH domain